MIAQHVFTAATVRQETPASLDRVAARLAQTLGLSPDQVASALGDPREPALAGRA